jgi:hypothetical protein
MCAVISKDRNVVRTAAENILRYKELTAEVQRRGV